jgi:peptidyl-prolyl cis-trans isomerase B (cyclophilin B)
LNVLAQKKSKKDYLITMKTNKGEMKLILFEDTPLHKANFLKLTQEGKFDSVIFHRVINEFMIQGGNLGLKTNFKANIGEEELEKIPYEFTSKHVHIKGALAAARTNNPERASSGSQFYIVTGKKYTEEAIAKMEASVAAKEEGRVPFKYTAEQIKSYKDLGGTPFLDNNYTVFGEVIQGIETAEAIEKVKTARGDKPIDDVWMVVSAKKMRKKKISKTYGYIYKG